MQRGTRHGPSYTLKRDLDLLKGKRKNGTELKKLGVLHVPERIRRESPF